MDDSISKILAACIQGGCTIVAVILAARFAVAKFHAEKRWEKVEAAYADLFNSLQISVEYYDSRVFSQPNNKDAEEQQKKLSMEFSAAEQHFDGLLRLGKWRLSSGTIRTLAELKSARASVMVASIGETNKKGVYREISTLYTKAILEIRKQAEQVVGF